MEKNSNFKESRKRAGHFGIAQIVSCTIIILFTVIAFIHPVQQILVSGPLLVFGLIFSPVAILMFVIVFFRQRKQTIRTTIYISGFVLFIYLLGCVGIFLYIRLPNVLFKNAGPLLFFFTTAIILSIVVSITLFRNKTIVDNILLLTTVVLLGISLVTIAPPTLYLTLPYVYTPQTLNSSNLLVYKQCLNLLKSRSVYENFKLNRSLWISLGSNLKPIIYEDTGKYFSEKEIMKIRTLRDQLYKVKCFQIQRNKDFVLYYKDGNYILPVGPGVVYSLSGGNPNEVDNDTFNTAKPFIRIAGNWYLSRGLILCGFRTNNQRFIPESLIDYSLRIDGIDHNELNEFD